MKFIEENIKERFISFFQEYRPELLLISISLVLIVLSLGIFVRTEAKSSSTDSVQIKTEAENNLNVETQTSKKTLFIDVSGAVQKPDVYELPEGARLRDCLMAAGGLSDKANREFFYRNYNLARILQDGEKVYVPKIGEEATLSKQSAMGSPVLVGQTGITDQQPNGINVNTVSLSELDSLPGIGMVTAGKIIANRPYQTIQDLLSRKIVSKSVFEKIKDKITSQ